MNNAHTPSELQPKSNPEMLIPTWDNFPVFEVGVEPGAEAVVVGTVVVAGREVVVVGVVLVVVGAAAPGRH